MVERLKGEFGFELFLDVTAIDHPAPLAALRRRLPLLQSPDSTRAFRLKVAGAGEVARRADTLTALYGSARFMEREVHDMYGIVVRRQCRPAPDPALRGVRRASAAQGLPDGSRAAHRALPAVTSHARSTPRHRSARLLEHTADPDNVVVNIGPSHPATHGTIQIVAELDGETVKTRRRALRLPAPRLREGGRAPHLSQGDSLHRSAQLLLRAQQQLRVRRRGGEAAGHRDHAALQSAAHAALRIQPDRRSPHLCRGLGDGDGRA